jgi:uncharacterized lipoprotein YajG
MRRIIATPICLTAAAILALAGCSSSDSTKPEKSSPTAVPSSAPAKLSAAEQLKACTDAIAGGQDSSAPECADLSSDDYLKALQDANQQGRDALLDGATADGQP